MVRIVILAAENMAYDRSKEAAACFLNVFDMRDLAALCLRTLRFLLKEEASRGPTAKKIGVPQLTMNKENSRLVLVKTKIQFLI